MPFPLPHRLIFMRHGETDWNREGRLQGQRDVPLNARGRDQARGVGADLRQLVGDGRQVDFIASPLERTRETMELARHSAGFLPADTYAMDDRLKEISFGDWEGTTWDELAARDPARVRERKRDKWGYVPPGGESYAMLAERVRPWLESLSGDTVTVAHGGVARALMVLLADTEPVQAMRELIHQGRILLFEGGAFRWV
ncbi:histidine phosphatase family protein [Methylovirgula sp. 4M-Z18]|uniref:histidine phosphatase family protein n=1 Tax=Methylovirgula sp. 4M-Z18 TaxID=2293567 RepID=UPI000E2F842F|nr:histidine phosphatase family protein [Methylovirgula sp. 4M-Z18]RFB80111.1 histidine phosphatase family protein [Methylovirgula sp. 4M-Z18]